MVPLYKKKTLSYVIFEHLNNCSKECPCSVFVLWGADLDFLHPEGGFMEKKWQLPDEDTLIDLAELFKIFGDSTRVKILFALQGGEMAVGDVALELGMTDSAISHQLKILKDSKLVRGRREGKQIYYSLADQHVVSILNQGMEHVCE